MIDPGTSLGDDFNPRAYVRHDGSTWSPLPTPHFNPRAYVRHDGDRFAARDGRNFNPRAYVRHDGRGRWPRC